MNRGSYSGGPVGRAYVGTLCHAHDSCGIAFDDAKSPAAMTASIMSHEMGHNFGMHHDDDRCQCPLGDCVMAAAIGYAYRTSDKFTPSSIPLCSALTDEILISQSTFFLL
jgi:hypothetical protein